MTPLYNKELIKRRFARHLEGYDTQSFVQKEICERISLLLEAHVGEIPNGQALEIGAGTGFLTQILLDRYPCCRWTINDLVEETRPFLEKIAAHSAAQKIEYLFCDAETAPLPQGLSLAASASAMQWFNSPATFLDNMYQTLLPGGWFVFSTFGPENFREVQSASHTDGLNYPQYQEIAAWCKRAGFEIIHKEEYLRPTLFESPHSVLRYIKDTGMNGTGNHNWTKKSYNEFCHTYKAQFSEEEKVKLTFNPILFVVRKPKK